MADVQRLLIGRRITLTGSTPAAQNHTCDANNDGVAWACQARDGNAITHLGFRYGARTGTPPTYRISLQSLVASTGHPDGTVLGGGSPASATFTPPADVTWDGTWQWVALSNSYTPTAGQFFAVVIEYSSGSVDSSNLSTFTSHWTNTTISSAGFPVAKRLTAGSWANQTGCPCFGVRTASSRYGNPFTGFYTTRTASTVGHRCAMKFTLPAGMGDTFKVSGGSFIGSPAAASGKAPVFGLWSASAAIHSFATDTEYFSFPTALYQSYELGPLAGSLTALSFGTAYYLGWEVADAASAGALITGIQLDNAADRDAWGNGTDVCLSNYNGSSWTDDGTVVPMVQLVVDDITEPAGGGGGGGPLIGGRLVF